MMEPKSDPKAGHTLELKPTHVSEALIAWAKNEISSVSTTRFEVAKFFFSASTVATGFFVAVWKEFHPKAPFSGPVFWCLATLCCSVAFALYMFWPVIRVFEEVPKIQHEHARFVTRLKWEGALWAFIWCCGVGLGLYAVLSIPSSR